MCAHERFATTHARMRAPPLPHTHTRTHTRSHAHARTHAHAHTQAWLYDPYAPAGARFKVMAATNIKRLYHSVAMLMPDGDVLVMGSEQGEGV